MRYPCVVSMSDAPTAAATEPSEVQRLRAMLAERDVLRRGGGSDRRHQNQSRDPGDQPPASPNDQNQGDDQKGGQPRVASVEAPPA